ncbi:perlucin-like [Dreissena polymorpha]|uniref:C-type lectin domain-containing protein n=1 Tax=Dreissena polymorpha TaxID=45954 RepID=A0A9D4JJR6_DREPO|nr:perlucin-like [Dreissena polymorpha]KAH3815001.1 hypothetical protein DPMN_143520 [Dreissena polymorpha]
MKFLKSLVILVVQLCVLVSGQCPNGFELNDNSCYKVSALEASWIEAKSFCRLLGSELLVIETATEEAIVEGLLTKLHGSHIDEDYWASGADIARENDWRWMTSDGVSFRMNYTHWGAGQPDNGGGNSNCLVIHFHGVRTIWNDTLCSQLHSFICEARAQEQEVIVG